MLVVECTVSLKNFRGKFNKYRQTLAGIVVFEDEQGKTNIRMRIEEDNMKIAESKGVDVCSIRDHVTTIYEQLKYIQTHSSDLLLIPLKTRAHLKANMEDVAKKYKLRYDLNVAQTPWDKKEMGL